MPMDERIIRLILLFSRPFYFFIMTGTLCQRDCHCWDDLAMGIACVANSNGTMDALTRHILVASPSRPSCSLKVRRPFCSSLSSISSNLESCILMKGISIICSQAAYVADLSICTSLSCRLNRVEMGHESIKKEINSGNIQISIKHFQTISIVCALNVQQNNPH